MGDTVWRVEGEMGTLGSVVEGLSGSGGRPAVVAFGEGGGESWSYRELAARVRRLALGLRGVEVERGDHVAILRAIRPEWIAACPAAISAGAVVVPLDAQIGDEALGSVLTDSDAGHVSITSDQAGRLEKLGEDVGLRPILLDVGDEAGGACCGWGRGVAWARTGRRCGAVLHFGHDGAAKGVPLSHANLAFQIESLLGADLVSEDDRILLPLPLHHVYPFAMGMLTPLAAGLPIILPHSLMGPQLVRALREGEATLIVGVPRLYHALYSGIEERLRSAGRLAAALFENGVDLFARLRRLTGVGRRQDGPAAAAPEVRTEAVRARLRRGRS